ncbi:MAG TPA: adenylate/guanylate cyclase domain-containing protein [Dehalococcoidia bacterium]
MEPEVRYCTTTDGVRIAYTVTGEGPPHVFVMEPMVSHVLLEWAHPVFGVLVEELSRHNTLVRYDPRGCGLSDRVYATTIEDQLLDLEAVVMRVGVDTFALSAVQSQSPMAITFAERHAGTVKRLVLVDGGARLADLLGTQQVRALISLAATDFVMATEVIGAVAFGTGREESRDHGAYIRSCVDPELFATAEVTVTWDASREASTVTAPTLIVRHRGIQYVTDAMTRELAALIPNSRLTQIDGLWADDPAGMGARIAEFINAGDTKQVRRARDTASGVRTVLVTDIVGHTRMMQRLGDAKGRDVLRKHERITRETLKAHGGAEVKTMGDGFMASFGTVTSAMDCAIALQRAFAAHTTSMPEPLHVRVGLNAGEPIEEDGDLFGSTVIMASRIAAKADVGEILIPEPLRHLLTGKSYVYADRGETVLKGFEDAVRLYEVRWQE